MAWLLERREALPGLLVVVPTAQSGRRLRETLAEIDGSILAPKVATPGSLMRTDSPEIAPDWMERVAWAEILEEIRDWRDYEALFPEKPGEGAGWAAGLAGELTNLRRSIQENGLTLQTAAWALSGSPEEDRWKNLADLEKKLESRLGRWERKSRSRVLAEGFELPDVREIVLAGVPEMPPVVERVLETGKPKVTVLIGAPSSRTNHFSPLGKPLVTWNQDLLPWPEGERGSVKIAADPRQQAVEALEAVARGGRPSDQIALGSADAETGVELQRAFTRAGWIAFQPSAGQVVSGLQRWFQIWREWLSKPTLACMADLLTLPETVALIGGTLHRRARNLAKLRDDWMCLDVADLRRRVQNEELSESRKQDAEGVLSAAEILESIRLQMLGRDFTGSLRKLLVTVAERVESTRGDATEMLQWLDEAEALISNLDRGAGYWIDLMLGSLAAASASPPDGRIIDVQGWLELFHEPGPHLVLCGMNEGNIPSRGGGEPWLSEPIRKRLGLVTDEDRAARDAYLFTAMIEARKKNGRVDLICGKTGSGGETMLPSRFLLSAEKEKLPSRVRALFREIEPPEAGMRWEADWKWKPRVVGKPEKLHVTSFRDYLKCPFRYYLKHVVRMKSPDPDRSEWSARDFGNVAHAVVEAWGRDEEAREYSKEDALAAYFSNELDREIAAQFGKQIPLAVRIQAESMRQRLSWLARKQACERASGWRVEAVERGITFNVADMLVSAKIDRIDRHEDGRIRIIDYKTGKISAVEREHRQKLTASVVAPEHLDAEGPAFYDGIEKNKPARFLWRDLQLPLYAAALAKSEGYLAVPGYFTLGQTEADVALHEWDGFSEDDLQAAEACADWVAGKIAAGVFWPPAERVPYDDYAILACGRPLEEMVGPIP
ncbi:MAG TPA: PD-(D/E)XK nuclease family protein [Luteolibacter sp.]|nr:PD-(D/E)XK nuclease family protein [Luteolibacter sp.]